MGNCCSENDKFLDKNEHINTKEELEYFIEEMNYISKDFNNNNEKIITMKNNSKLLKKMNVLESLFILIKNSINTEFMKDWVY